MKADQIAALVRAHNQGDGERFRAMTLSIAANLHASSPRWAKTLTNLAEQSSASPMAQKMTVIGGGETGLLAQSRATTTLEDMVISMELAEDIGRVLAEHAGADKLAEYELGPARKLLFVGPPGVGKTMLAAALANRLGIPMFRIQLHAVCSQYLGETSKKLGQIFDSIRLFRGVYLFDEFDALASKRDGDHDDVGEMRRVVNSLLVMIEEDRSDSLIIGATNLVGMIDRAMFRRFDHVLAFRVPGPVERETLIRSRLVFPLADGPGLAEVVSASQGASHADLVWACADVSKSLVLAGDRTMTGPTELVNAIHRRRGT